ncbi:MAG: Na+/H+ antiporter NhaC family protein [Flavobacteriales bacterium]|nr:Na+/H+ antiporter NhaC family protein [Flavobacteriales bacterium]
MKNILFLFLILFSGITYSQEQEYNSFELDFPDFVIEGIEYEIIVNADFFESKTVPAKLNGNEEIRLEFEQGRAIITSQFKESGIFQIAIADQLFEKEVNPIHLWMSIIPPLLAIVLALLIREVVSSLLLGIFVGALIIQLYTHGMWGILYGFMAMIDTYILGAINDSGHISIIIFSTLIGGMVSVISKNGGMQGVVNRISKYAKNAQSGQFATWFLGIAIFFDDYANTLIVGNTMRPITDKLRISREKLAYLVDSTAAPVASIAFVTTWIGAELGYIESGISSIVGLDEGVYATFVNSLAYSFYPILALIFMLILIWKQKDFGPMYSAEIIARQGEIQTTSAKESDELSEEFSAKKGIKIKSYNAVIPVLIVVVGTISGLLYTGWDASIWSDTSLSFTRKLSSTIGNADSYQALLWSSAAGLIAAIALSIFQKILSLSTAIETSIQGFKTMLSAVIILVLAWSLAGVIENMHTADLLTSLLSDNISPYFIPAITFLLAVVVAFSTGSSWGTMAILYPLMLPASWEICTASGMDYQETLSIFHNVVSCVLAGAVLGDHCSPISDTTILSSLASSCNHIDHVRTQMPYALTVGLVAIVFGTIPSAFGIPLWICMPIGISVLYLIVHFKGKSTDSNII